MIQLYGGFHKWGYPNSWMVYIYIYVYIMETPIKMDDLGVPHGTPISPPYLQRSHLTPQEWSETPGDNTWTKRLRSDVKLADSFHGSVSIASQLESSGLGFRIASGRNEFQSYKDVRKTSALRELAVQLKNAKTTQGRLFKSSRDSSATTMGSRGLLLRQSWRSLPTSAASSAHQLDPALRNTWMANQRCRLSSCHN